MQSRPKLQVSADALRSHRLRSLLSQEELADQASLSLATIKSLEAKDRPVFPKTVKKLCRALACAPDDIAGIAQPEESVA